MREAFNIDEVMANTISYMSMVNLSNVTTFLDSLDILENGLINLDNLAKHGIIEHDASLTRKDLAEGDQITLQPNLVQELLDDSPNEYITMESLARTRVRRDEYSVSKGSGIPMNMVQQLLSFGEAATILEAFGERVEGYKELVTRKEYVKTWLLEERFPDGWKPVNKATLRFGFGLAARMQEYADTLRKKNSR
jgi:hypothetical protein